MCLQESRYPEAPATLLQDSSVPLSLVFSAVKPLTLGRSTGTETRSVLLYIIPALILSIKLLEYIIILALFMFL